MGVLDKLAGAETSSDLRHYSTLCAVDILKAAGIAGMYAPIHVALFRLKYLNDKGELSACKAIFTRWAYRSMLNHKIAPGGASRIGAQALAAWLDDTCRECSGQRYRVIEGTPALSAKVCSVCDGLGKKPIKGELAEVTKDIFEMADDVISSMRERLEDRLR